MGDQNSPDPQGQTHMDPDKIAEVIIAQMRATIQKQPMPASAKRLLLSELDRIQVSPLNSPSSSGESVAASSQASTAVSSVGPLEPVSELPEQEVRTMNQVSPLPKPAETQMPLPLAPVPLGPPSPWSPGRNGRKRRTRRHHKDTLYKYTGGPVYGGFRRSERNPTLPFVNPLDSLRRGRSFSVSSRESTRPRAAAALQKAKRSVPYQKKAQPKPNGLSKKYGSFITQIQIYGSSVLNGARLANLERASQEEIAELRAAPIRCPVKREEGLRKTSSHKCLLCDKFYATRFHLICHIERAHFGAMKPCKCSSCGNSFASLYTAISHVVACIKKGNNQNAAMDVEQGPVVPPPPTPSTSRAALAAVAAAAPTPSTSQAALAVALAATVAAAVPQRKLAQPTVRSSEYMPLCCRKLMGHPDALAEHVATVHQPTIYLQALPKAKPKRVLRSGKIRAVQSTDSDQSAVEMDVPEESQGREHKCGVCEAVFLEEVYLAYHMCAVHGQNDERFPICPECKQVTKDQNDLVAHMQQVHPKRPRLMDPSKEDK